MYRILEQIRSWKNRTFTDWQWDLLVGGVCVLVAFIIIYIPKEWFIIIVPLVITIINQIYNKKFEPLDFILRMIIPVAVFIIQLIK